MSGHTYTHTHIHAYTHDNYSRPSIIRTAVASAVTKPCRISEGHAHKHFDHTHIQLLYYVSYAHSYALAILAK